MTKEIYFDTLRKNLFQSAQKLGLQDQFHFHTNIHFSFLLFRHLFLYLVIIIF